MTRQQVVRQSLSSKVINQDRQTMGWQILSLPKRTETDNGLANSDLPIMPKSFEKSMPAGICRIGIRQPIEKGRSPLMGWQTPICQ